MLGTKCRSLEQRCWRLEVTHYIGATGQQGTQGKITIAVPPRIFELVALILDPLTNHSAITRIPLAVFQVD